MTLVEVLVVVAIVATAATGVTYGFGALTRTNLRAACMKVVAASRFAYSRAVTEGKTVRIVLDASNHTLAFEEAHGKVTLVRGEEAEARAEEGAGEGDEAAIDPWEAAKARITTPDAPSLGHSPFSPVGGAAYGPTPVGDGIRIVRLILPHEPEPRSSGRGAIYYFPGGATERAVVQLASESDPDTVYSVEIHPLTGRGRVYTEAHVPPPVPDSDDDGSEVEDSG